jgi:Family of unknown function (DUF6165)
MVNAERHSRQIRAPIAIGELIDKIAILEIKAERISDKEKLRNVATELTMLRELKTSAGLDTPEMEPYAQELRALNATLWEVEDALRELEARHDFGPHFVKLARSVYQTNDRRAGVKQRINKAFGSAIVEEKSYKGS